MKTVLAVLGILTGTALACGGHAVQADSGEGGSGDDGSQGGGSAPLVTMNPDGTIPLAPTAVETNRYPVGCGVADPPYMNGDLFSVGIVPNGPATPYGLLSITFNSPVAVGTPLALTVQPFVMDGSQSGTTTYPDQTAQADNVRFVYSQGTGSSAIDTGAFDTVTFTLLAMPAQDGDPLTVRLQVHFVDGKVLDETYSGPVTTDSAGCPAG
jgi:hypothetical protein